jgi:hypothetical protein
MFNARSRSSRNTIDLDAGITSEVGDTDAGAGRAPVWREVAGVDRVHRRVVLPEMRQEDPDTHHSIEIQPQASQYQLEVLQHPASLGLDASGQRGQIVLWVVGDLPGDENPVAALDGGL